jgi:hypothetical protein
MYLKRLCHGNHILGRLPISMLALALISVPATAQDAPINKWQLRTMAPNHVHENDMAYDPSTGKAVFHGGHVGMLYPQSNYTFLYDVRRNRFFESQSQYRPQRRCFANVVYLDSCRMVLTGCGSPGHGSLPQGGFSKSQGDYRECYRAFNVGPWLYDGTDDSWSDCRPLPPKWHNKDVSAHVYERNSDVMLFNEGDKWSLYCPRTNRNTMRWLPEPLWARCGYAVAADPIRRKIVLFGGDTQFFFPRTKSDYEKKIRGDTWIYDMATDKWRQVQTKVSPAPGYPMLAVMSLKMVYHYSSDTMLMLQNPISEPPTDLNKIPPAELWSFDLDREEWSKVPVENYGTNGPSFIGLLDYARNEDLLVLIGGGKDFIGEDGQPGISPSRSVWTCRVRIPGREPAIPPPIERIRVETGDGANRVVWADAVRTSHPELERLFGGKPVGFIVYRARVSGLSGKTTAMYSADAPFNKAALEPPQLPPHLASTPQQPRKTWWGPDADPCPGVYERINRDPVLDGLFVDNDITPGAVYAYQITPNGAPPNLIRSLPAFNQPWHPTGLRASVEATNRILLRWNANTEQDIAGYKVYRAIGEAIEHGTGTLLTATPIQTQEFMDSGDNLSDCTVRFYWVTAINKGGIESGASPLAHSFPDQPMGLTVLPGEGPSNRDGILLGYRLRWEWPKDVKVAGFHVYYADHHRNGSNGPGGTYDQDWKRTTDKPHPDNEFVFPLAADDPRPNHYFHVRAVNILGQEGFYTDIVSPTDLRFRSTP